MTIIIKVLIDYLPRDKETDEAVEKAKTNQHD